MADPKVSVGVEVDASGLDASLKKVIESINGLSSVITSLGDRFTKSVSDKAVGSISKLESVLTRISPLFEKAFKQLPDKEVTRFSKLLDELTQGATRTGRTMTTHLGNAMAEVRAQLGANATVKDVDQMERAFKKMSETFAHLKNQGAGDLVRQLQKSREAILDLYSGITSGLIKARPEGFTDTISKQVLTSVQQIRAIKNKYSDEDLIAVRERLKAEKFLEQGYAETMSQMLKQKIREGKQAEKDLADAKATAAKASRFIDQAAAEQMQRAIDASKQAQKELIKQVKERAIEQKKAEAAIVKNQVEQMELGLAEFKRVENQKLQAAKEAADAKAKAIGFIDKAAAEKTKQLADEALAAEKRRKKEEAEAYNASFAGKIDAMVGRIGAAVQTSLAFGAVYGMINAVRGAIVTIVEFSQALENLKAISGATDIETAMMGKTILEVSRSTKFSVGEISKGMVFFAQAGFTAAESMAAIKQAATLAMGTLSSLEMTADLATTTIRAFALSANDMGRVADVMATAINRSKLDIEKLRTAFNYVGASAHEMGLSLEETAGTLMTLADHGMRASTIGTSLRQVLEHMVNPSDKMTKMLALYGLTMEDLNPRMVGYMTSLKNLSSMFVNVSDGTVNMTRAFEVFGVRGAQALSIVVDSLRSGNLATAINDTYEVGSAAQMASIQSEGLAVKFQKLRNNAQSLTVALGSGGLGGVLGGVADGLTGLLSGITEIMNNGFAKFILQVGTVTGALVVLLSTVRAVAATSFFTTLFPALAGLAGMAVGPIVAVATAIGAVAIGVTYLADNTRKSAEEAEKASIKYGEQVSKIQAYLTSFDKLNSDKEKFAGNQDELNKLQAEEQATITRLIADFPQYSDEIIKASGSYDKLYAVMKKIKELNFENQMKEFSKSVGAAYDLAREKEKYIYDSYHPEYAPDTRMQDAADNIRKEADNRIKNQMRTFKIQKNLNPMMDEQQRAALKQEFFDTFVNTLTNEEDINRVTKIVNEQWRTMFTRTEIAKPKDLFAQIYDTDTGSGNQQLRAKFEQMYDSMDIHAQTEFVDKWAKEQERINKKVKDIQSGLVPLRNVEGDTDEAKKENAVYQYRLKSLENFLASFGEKKAKVFDAVNKESMHGDLNDLKDDYSKRVHDIEMEVNRETILKEEGARKKIELDLWYAEQAKVIADREYAEIIARHKFIQIDSEEHSSRINQIEMEADRKRQDAARAYTNAKYKAEEEEAKAITARMYAYAKAVEDFKTVGQEAEQKIAEAHVLMEKYDYDFKKRVSASDELKKNMEKLETWFQKESNKIANKPEYTHAIRRAYSGAELTKGEVDLINEAAIAQEKLNQAKRDYGFALEKQNEEMRITQGDDLFAQINLGFQKSKSKVAEWGEFVVNTSKEASDKFADGFSAAFADFIMGTDNAAKSFAKFAQETLVWLGKMIVRQTMYSALMGTAQGGGLLNFLGTAIKGISLFSGGSSYDSSNMQNTTNLNVHSDFMHSGGVIGSGSGVRKMIDAPLFIGARKYHRGGIIAPDEVPVIAKRGERVLTEKQNAEYESKQVPNISITVENKTGSDMDMKKKGKPEFDGKQWVLTIVAEAINNNGGGVRDLIKGVS